jgi:hypothetical protein
MTAENSGEPIRCVHCLTLLPNKEVSKDHVFPSSWYTDHTSPRIQRWTVPSCKKCNARFGDLEKELFLRLAVCIDPAKAQAAGINRKLLRSFGIGPDIPDREKEIRRKLKDTILAESAPYAGDETLPGLGLHQVFSPNQSTTQLFSVEPSPWPTAHVETQRSSYAPLPTSFASREPPLFYSGHLLAAIRFLLSPILPVAPVPSCAVTLRI